MAKRELKEGLQKSLCVCGHPWAAHMEGECAWCGCETYKPVAEVEAQAKVERARKGK